MSCRERKEVFIEIASHKMLRDPYLSSLGDDVATALDELTLEGRYAPSNRLHSLEQCVQDLFFQFQRIYCRLFALQNTRHTGGGYQVGRGKRSRSRLVFGELCLEGEGFVGSDWVCGFLCGVGGVIK